MGLNRARSPTWSIGVVKLHPRPRRRELLDDMNWYSFESAQLYKGVLEARGLYIMVDIIPMYQLERTEVGNEVEANFSLFF